jgi:DGQHR domain-containing protein
MNTHNYFELEFIELNQPIGKYYIGKINWQQLIKIADADIRQIHKEDEKSDSLDSYLGIQRKVSQKRITEIGDYVKTVDATFPTSIILHINSKTRLLEDKELSEFETDYIEKNFANIIEIDNIIFDNNTRILNVRSSEKIARILDGQHRIEGIRKGFSDLDEAEIPLFELNVTIFVDLDIDDQAQVFSVINKAQTKVNNSLVYDLYEYAKNPSPQKSAHDIVRLLNKLPQSPFFRKIKILGTAENKELETIAQATFVELLLSYISKNPMKDRDILKKKSLFGEKLSILTDKKEIEKLIFRNLFIQKKDEVIMQTIWNFFKVVQDKWPESWKNGSGNVLNKSTGIIALFRFMRPVINSIGVYDRAIEIEEFENLFKNISIQDLSFTKENYIPGTSGQSQLYKELLEQSGIII